MCTVGVEARRLDTPAQTATPPSNPFWRREKNFGREPPRLLLWHTVVQTIAPWQHGAMVEAVMAVTATYKVVQPWSPARQPRTVNPAINVESSPPSRQQTPYLLVSVWCCQHHRSAKPREHRLVETDRLLVERAAILLLFSKSTLRRPVQPALRRHLHVTAVQKSKVYSVQPTRSTSYETILVCFQVVQITTATVVYFCISL